MQCIEKNATSAIFDIYIDKKYQTVFITLSGLVVLQDLIEAFSATLNHPDFEVNMSCIYDMRDAILDSDIKEAEIMSHYTSGFSHQRGKSYLLAFVVTEEMTKMLVEFYRLLLTQTDIQVCVTDEMTKAIQWIRTSDA